VAEIGTKLDPTIFCARDQAVVGRVEIADRGAGRVEERKMPTAVQLSASGLGYETLYEQVQARQFARVRDPDPTVV